MTQPVVIFESDDDLLRCEVFERLEPVRSGALLQSAAWGVFRKRSRPHHDWSFEATRPFATVEDGARWAESVCDGLVTVFELHI